MPPSENAHSKLLRELGFATVIHGLRSRFLMDETELRQGRQLGDGDGGCRLHGCCDVIDRLIRDVGGGRVGAIVSASVPWDTKTLDDKLVSFLHAGAFDAAQNTVEALGSRTVTPRCPR